MVNYPNPFVFEHAFQTVSNCGPQMILCSFFFSLIVQQAVCSWSSPGLDAYICALWDHEEPEPTTTNLIFIATPTAT
jgi:hypothetical protein